MNYYAVIDTNVIVSAMLNPDSIPGMILKYALAGIIIPLINNEILNEYCDVINRDKFDFNKNDINDVLSSIKQNAITLEKTATEEEFVDKKDIVFHEIVLTAQSKTESYLVTGNIKHFPNKPFVVTPKEMVDIINNSQF